MRPGDRGGGGGGGDERGGGGGGGGGRDSEGKQGWTGLPPYYVGLKQNRRQ